MQLSVLKETAGIEAWDDGHIKGGEDWRQRIDSAMKTCDAADGGPDTLLVVDNIEGRNEKKTAQANFLIFY